MCTERELPTWWSWTSKPTKVSRPGASAQVVCRHVANSCWNPCAEIEDSGLVARNSVLIVKRVPSAWKGPRESKSAVCRICSIPGHLAVHCPHTGYVKRAPQAVREGAFESAMHSWCNFPRPAANPASQAWPQQQVGCAVSAAVRDAQDSFVKLQSLFERIGRT